MRGMRALRLFAVSSGLVGLLGCDSGWTLSQFTSRSVSLVATDVSVPAYDLMLEYDVQAKGCARIGGVRATQDGQGLNASERGGPGPDAADDCPFPRWPLLRGAADSTYTTLKLEDGTGKIQAVFRSLFAKRSVALTSAPTGRVGDSVDVELQPITDTASDIEASFLANGAAAVDKVVWFNATSGQASFEGNKVHVTIPARQSPATGKLTVAATLQPEVFACEGADKCRTQALVVSVESAFTVTP